MARPLISRKRDILYLVFFLIHLPIMFTVDLTSLYPQSIHDAMPFFKQVHRYQFETNGDRFFSGQATPYWFRVFTLLEAIYHVPFSVWAIGALVRDDPMVPLQLLIFAAEVALTTLPCMTEILGWEEVTPAQRGNLLGMYGGYFGLGIFMAVDMYTRLHAVVKAHARLAQTAKAQ